MEFRFQRAQRESMGEKETSGSKGREEAQRGMAVRNRS